MSARLIPDEVFYPEDIAMLQKVFDEYCVEHGFHPDTPDCNLIAANLITLFQLGCTTEDALRDAIHVRNQLLMTG